MPAGIPEANEMSQADFQWLRGREQVPSITPWGAFSRASKIRKGETQPSQKKFCTVVVVVKILAQNLDFLASQFSEPPPPSRLRGYNKNLCSVACSEKLKEMPIQEWIFKEICFLYFLKKPCSGSCFG